MVIVDTINRLGYIKEQPLATNLIYKGTLLYECCSQMIESGLELACSISLK